MEYYIGSMPVGDDELEHFGIKGMKWGRRNYQNADGSLTAAGRMRYGAQRGYRNAKRWGNRQVRNAKRWGNRQVRNAKRWGNRQVRNAKQYYSKNRDTINRVARIAGATALAGGAAYLGYRNRGAIRKIARTVMHPRRAAEVRKVKKGMNELEFARRRMAFREGGKDLARGTARDMLRLRANRVGAGIKNAGARARNGVKSSYYTAKAKVRFSKPVRWATSTSRKGRDTVLRGVSSTKSGLRRMGSNAKGALRSAESKVKASRATSKLARAQGRMYAKTGIVGPQLSKRRKAAIDASNVIRRAAGATYRGGRKVLRSKKARRLAVGSAALTGAYAYRRKRRK